MTDSRADVGAELLGRIALESRERPVWLRVGQLFDGTSDHLDQNADLVFDAHTIRYVNSDGRAPDPQLLKHGRRTPDAVLADYTVLPCLIEAHAHMFLDGAPIELRERERYLQQPAEWMLARARTRWRRILQCGVAAVRDAGDKHGVGLALAAEAKSRLGELAIAPWIDSPGAAIHHRGRYGAFMSEPIEDYPDPANCVAARVAAGADRIKLLVSGIIDFKVGRVTAKPQMSITEVAALVNAARQHGRQTFAHASGTEGVEHAIEGGVTTVEHGFFITEDQLARMRDRQIAWVPTFAPVQLQIDHAGELGWSDEVVGHLQRIIESHRQMLCRAHEMGVRIVAGSDAGSCGVPHGIGFLHELSHMERAGLPPLSVLRSATGASAEILSFAEPNGQIAAGCRSRFIFTCHDPSASVAHLLRDKIVVFDGSALHCLENLNPAGL